jgi:hypothetical protein
MKWEWSVGPKTPDHRQPPLGGLHDIHAGFWRGYWQVFGLAGAAIKVDGVSTNPSSRFRRKPVVFGCSFLLTAAGQFRVHTGFPLRALLERDQQA